MFVMKLPIVPSIFFFSAMHANFIKDLSSCFKYVDVVTQKIGFSKLKEDRNLVFSANHAIALKNRKT